MPALVLRALQHHNEMAPNQTALSATTMSPLVTDANSHHLQHQPCVYTAFSSKRRRLSPYLVHDTLTSPNPSGVEQALPSTAHASSSARKLPPTIPADIRFYVPGCVIDSATLPLAAVGGVSTVATTGSTIYHTLVGNSIYSDTSMTRHIPQRMSLCPTSATLPSRPYPGIVAGNPALFYIYQPQPMGPNMSALECWQSQLGHATTPPPLVVDLEDYNSDSSAVTNEMPHLSYPMLPSRSSRASA
eukprot:scaffold46042_cov75-Attheya_sp.AAC.3